ncbi:hypothetical protein CLOHAE12215_01262 [Clostridium haemolyticum]|uniref:RAMP superfamily CRISPR-associated protein n=1 Tax=Clostridium haemolyticum TaxID=84025 RepID=UPI001C39A866|nr:RAMP superfamily CRISPR-associated protein [Clostridium haemolyticum]CAG7839847.1 hypothetical protein CLOHAE12215_01262 [Clostridium haemolyticum]
MSNVNKIRKYKVVVKNISPLKIGNGEDEGFQLVLQDNKACISGTTMAGLFREFLINNKEIKKDSDIYKKIYSDSKEISTIFFYDSFSEQDIKENDIECRPHIRIDEKTGTAVQGALFSECHINEGKKFEITFEIKGLEINEEQYERICDYLEEFLYLLGNGEKSIGSKSTFGFGLMQFDREDSCYFKEFDLTNEQDLEDYLNDISIYNIKNKVKFKDYTREKHTSITFKAYCEDGLIIKGDKEKICVNDKYFYKNISYREMKIKGKDNEEDYKYVIPSSTIKGIVQSYSRKILLTLEKDLEILKYIFGEKTNERETKKGKRGNLVFYDYKISKDRFKESEKNQPIYNRIKIDRFTGGTFQGSLFKNQVIIFNENTKELEFKISISNRLKNVEALKNNRLFEKAIALIILTFRDMGFGYVTVGSGNNVGFGRLQGNSILIDENEHKYEAKFQNDKLVGDIEKFEKYIKILNE